MLCVKKHHRKVVLNIFHLNGLLQGGSQTKLLTQAISEKTCFMHGFLQERSNAYTSIIFTEESVSNKVSSVTLFSPILTYSSEVWGIYDKCDFSSWENDPIEKRHIHFCKMCLGLNKR